MEFKQFFPSDILKPYVGHYYLFESDSDAEFVDTVFPSGDMEMIFNLGGGVWETSVDDEFRINPKIELWGQVTKPLQIRSKGKHSMLGIRFFTHSAAYFLNEEMGVFNDQVLDLAYIIGDPVKILHAQMLETADIKSKIGLIEDFLIRKLISNERKTDKIEKVGSILRTIKNNYSDTNLSLVASKYNVTPRYMHKLIQQCTGLSPKSFNKISRFQLSLKMLSAKAQPLTSIAYDCGYFDQSHFIRDFKSFTGQTPSAYMENMTPVNNLLLQ
ncbi:AraC family transcriptional regulator [Dyadobacter chenwenxiniae]|uniref:AraC family transcriptional regulator n=1 Tax=Dyadobacter chenwenxiniae TaxID=2906456 RepID=A0A9X1PMW4_9BACT|nr:AraC family transcriptional regulator [Dyadobacter chenwenxiniae]MCF0064297.1 AraC family transcriptional regulator [Dyadobacter chenwenxiniae]UON82491.1 AraC family transcriptional regulator [Dyadobacter chenwenxiniae]